MPSKRFSAAKLTKAQLQAIVEKLGGEEGALRFLRGETKVSSLPPTEFKIWRTVRIGTGLKSPNAFRKALKSGKFRIGNHADIILDSPVFTVANKEVDIDLIVIKVSELGFKNGAQYQNICAKALELGLMLCPAEIGPQLRLQYQNQPKDEWLRIAMEAVSGSDCSHLIFALARSQGGRWLRGGRGHAESVWRASSRFVFVLPSK